VIRFTELENPVRLNLILCSALAIVMISACSEEPAPSAGVSQVAQSAVDKSVSPELPGDRRDLSIEHFRMISDGAPSSLDPIKANSVYAAEVILNTYDTLYRYQLFSNSYQLRPNLAAAMPVLSEDGKVLRIAIREDTYFQDHPSFADGKGRQVTAHDVIYSLKRHFVPNNFSDGAWQFQDSIVGVKAWVDSGAKMDQPLAGLKAINDHLLEVRLNAPNVTLPFVLASAYSAVVPVEAVEKLGVELARQTVGSGPFVLKEFSATRTVMQRNPNFRQEAFDLAAEGYVESEHGQSNLAAMKQFAGKLLPLTDTIEINYVSEASSILLGLQNGSIQDSVLPATILARFLDPSPNGPALKAQWQKRFSMRKITELGAVFISFNMLDPHVGESPDPAISAKHKALRCAIRDAYSWSERIEKVFNGSAVSFAGVIPPMVAGTSGQAPSFDPKAAKLALAKAGYTPEQLPILQFGSTSDDEQRKAFELFRAQMLTIGFPLEKIQWQSFPSFGAYIEAVNRSEIMLMDMGWAMDVPDAENMLQLYYGPYKAPQVNNANYQNARFDADFEKIRTMTAGPERTKIMARMNQQLIDDCVVIGSMSRQAVALMQKPWVGISNGAHLRFIGRGPQ
jgi:oligopeptide transport system substrate-binding protein